MKKFTAVILTVLMLVCVFAACSKSVKNETPMPVSGSSSENAVISGAQAREYIKTQYTFKELGIKADEASVDFSYSESPYEFEGEEYTVIKAMTFEKNPDVTLADGSATYSTTIVGEYLVALDASKAYMKNMKTGAYTELDNRIDAYQTKGVTVASTEAE